MLYFRIRGFIMRIVCGQRRTFSVYNFQWYFILWELNKLHKYSETLISIILLDIIIFVLYSNRLNDLKFKTRETNEQKMTFHYPTLIADTNYDAFFVRLYLWRRFRQKILDKKCVFVDPNSEKRFNNVRMERRGVPLL